MKVVESKPIKRVFLVCSGLGHVNRGFESFTQECFDAISTDPRIDVHLFKGFGVSRDRVKTLWCLKRKSRFATVLGKLIGRDGYYVETTTFALALIGKLVKSKPDVVFFSDGVVGNLLWRWKRISGASYTLLLSNGGPLGPPLFPRFDHVHQVSPVFYEESAKAGRLAQTQSLLPYGFNIPKSYEAITDDDRNRLRKKLGLPADRKIVLVVGAINRGHKRTDYVIEELASLPRPRPFLVLLGQFDSDTPGILKLARERLGEDGFAAKTVPPSELVDYYRSADLFVLGSISEGFPRVLGEASSHGLLCLTHDSPIQRYVLGEEGCFADFSIRGNLASILTEQVGLNPSLEKAIRRFNSAKSRFSWDTLKSSYVDMILRCGTNE